MDVSLAAVLREVSDAVAVEEAALLPTPIPVRPAGDVVASAA
jgi:hypothetical protein